MRTGFVAAVVVCSSFVAGAASAGQSHYLLARPFNQFTNSKSVSPPDLTGYIESDYGLGVAGANPANIQNHAEVSSDAGYVLLASQASRPIGDPSIVNPIDWTLASRFEEHIDPGTATGLSVSYAFSASGMLTTTIPMIIKLSGTIVLDGCQYHFERVIRPGAFGDLTQTDGCVGKPGFTASGGPSGVTITATQLRKAMNLEAQVDAVFSYSGGFTGSFGLNVKGNVNVAGVGGTPVFKSPTFGSKATPPVVGDGGTSGGTSGASGGTSGTSGTSGGTNDDAGAGSSSGGGDSGGCTTATNDAPATGSTLASVGLVLGAALIAQRIRRRRR